jgi:hypothetical protein
MQHRVGGLVAFRATVQGEDLDDGRALGVEAGPVDAAAAVDVADVVGFDEVGVARGGQGVAQFG